MYTKLQTFLSRHILVMLGAAIIALTSFQLGMIAGFHKASFNYHMGDNYYRTFGSHDGHGGPFNEAFTNAHGASGKIISVSLPTFVIDDHGVEKVVRISTTTALRKQFVSATSADITTNTYAIVLGEPNDKTQIDAQLVRLLPAPNATSTH